LVCICNEVPLSAIEAAIARGATSLAEVFDATFAGCGPCGGSCQERIAQLLRERARRPFAPPPRT
jgi:bacterioferritin-associated ferredoxin